MNINWDSYSLKILGGIGIVFLILSIVTYYFPPKKPNRWIGYQSAFSIKSQDHWDFAQRYHAILMMKCSVFMIITALFISFFSINILIDTLLSTPLVLIIAGLLFFKTERAIRKRFGKN